MIRFITHILDIKNLLGMQRNTPPMPIVCVCKTSYINSCSLRLYFNGDQAEIVYNDYYDAELKTLVATHSPYAIGINPDPDTDITISGDIYQLGVFGMENMIVGNTIQTLNFLENYGWIECPLISIDLRNADNLHLVSATKPLARLETIYANAKTSGLANISTQLINDAVLATGDVYVDVNEPYASTVITAANNKGWTIHYL